MFLLVLKKFGLALLNIVAFFVGIFLWGLTLYPFNFPYLLKLPQEADHVIAAVFALTFVNIVVVSVRTKWCFENDLFLAEEGDKWWTLPWRIIQSEDWVADVVVCALYLLVLSTIAGVTSGAPWYAQISGTLLLTVGGVLVFGVLDCLLYVIARKKADKQLRKREEK